VGNKCHNCGKFRHHAKDCWSKKKDKDKDKRIKRNWNREKKGKNKTNVGEYIAFPVEEKLHNFDSFNACNTGVIDECLIYYNWVADSATTSHISHQHCGRDFNLLVVCRSGYHVMRGYVSKNKGMRGVKEIERAPWCAGN